MSSEALRAEAKKLKSQKTVFAMFLGFLLGIAVWAAISQKTALTFILLALALLLSRRQSGDLKSLQEELRRRNMED